MLIVQYSSVFNHHSVELADELYKLCKGNYYFVETLKEEDERKQLGYHPYSRPYVIQSFGNAENKSKAERLALEADVMIAGVFPYDLVKKRLIMGKLVFLCQERIFKGETNTLRMIRVWQYCVRKYLKYNSLYLLSIGENCARDYHRIGFFKNKSFQWAYFPLLTTKSYFELSGLKNNQKTEILFVGRLIPLKHPEYVINAVKKLASEDANVHLSVIGDGILGNALKEYVAVNNLDKYVDFLGAMPPEKVLQYMEKANILAFTSDSNEGWGAVLSEAMGMACGIIASGTAGASSTLIKNGVNGVLYNDDDYEEFERKIIGMVYNHIAIEKMGENAYRTMHDLYCAKVAARRFISVARSILAHEPIPKYSNGPMKMM